MGLFWHLVDLCSRQVGLSFLLLPLVLLKFPSVTAFMAVPFLGLILAFIFYTMLQASGALCSSEKLLFT
jgi:hypothetical protein